MRAQPLSIFLSLFCLYATPVLAIVIRHDVAEEQYLVEQAPPAMIDMPHEGHGMLIAPEWVVTAAHVIFYDYKDKETVRVGDAQHEIDYIIFHPGYSKPAEGLFTGDSAPSQAYLRANHDIALIKLKRPATTILEGMQGSGDSGGPALIHNDGVDYLAGLASWDVYEGDLADFKAGVYGLGAQLIRLSYYADWIDEVMQWPDAVLSKRHYKIGRSNADQ